MNREDVTASSVTTNAVMISRRADVRILILAWPHTEIIFVTSYDGELVKGALILSSLEKTLLSILSVAD